MITSKNTHKNYKLNYSSHGVLHGFLFCSFTDCVSLWVSAHRIWNLSSALSQILVWVAISTLRPVVGLATRTHISMWVYTDFILLRLSYVLCTPSSPGDPYTDTGDWTSHLPASPSPMLTHTHTVPPRLCGTGIRHTPSCVLHKHECQLVRPPVLLWCWSCVLSLPKDL